MTAKLQNLFGEIVRRRREEAGLTQEALGGEASLSRNYVGMVERGERVPTIVSVQQFARALKTTMVALIQELEEAVAAQAKPGKAKASDKKA